MIELSRIQRSVTRSPFLWGGLASAVFYWLVHTGVLSGQFVERYFASHPVEYAATIMFFMGLAALGAKIADMLAQYPRLSDPLLGSASSSGRAGDDARALLKRLQVLSVARQHDYLPRRLRDALDPRLRV